ncbi:TonB-dependent receptor [Flavobacterium sediminilitoris]|uniref:TonB-dependent receptor n=1 Tax=Flavobacterium sediminilitoris TaxID=2024526 RepID=A0ABY4HRW4_9FLAO|nr:MULTISPECIES: TonB-dependent receptor [Flavobacterium]UOX35448.1 TonB-dependent receptor [Flavobacterium sediminilitoris]
MKTLQKKLLFFMLILPIGMFAQNILKGTVIESTTQQPLPSVNIAVEGNSTGTATDFDGNFTLSNLNKGDKIIFTYLGFVKQTILYNGQKEITVYLVEDTNQLEGIVVIGYGTVKKKDATGAVTTLKASEFNKGTVVTAENLLNGRVAGLTVNTSGAPGSGSEIRIRGGSSLFASNDPLIVIDGLPIENSSNTGSTSILAGLNPSDIESFTVLKDASATAIYGSRASNGVIIITTKKGGKELNVDYNVQYATGKLVKKVSVFSADEFRDVVTAQFPEGVGLLGNANTDWQEEIYRKTDFIDNNISVRGNLFNKIPSRLSLGNTYQEGLRLTNEFNRNTIGVALNPSFLDNHLKINVSANYANERNRFAEGVEGAALRFDPTQPVYDANSYYGGFFEYWNQATNPSNAELTPSVVRNPVSQLLQTNDRGINNRLFGNFEIDYKFHFLPDLRAVINLGFDESKGERTKIVSRFTGSSPNNDNRTYGANEFTDENRKNKSLDTYFNYKKQFNSLEVDATAGYSYQKFEGSKFTTGNINQPNYTSAIADVDTFADIVLIGFFGRTNFTYNDKYILTLSYRRDGSSRFSKENRWGNFPAAAFAWKLKEEFLQNSKFVTDLKLRLGYGITGQQDINDRLSYLQQYVTGNNQSQYFFGNLPNPIAVSTPYNPNLKWEETTTYNVGFDYGLFNNRITGTIDAFYKKSEDLLVRSALPDGGNFSNRGFQNIGDMTIKGIEFAINAVVVEKDNFKWDVNFNATKFERRIDELALDADIFIGGIGSGTGGTAQIYREGFTPYSYYVYKQLYNTNGQPIEGAYADLNGDGIVNGDDRYIYKNPDPDATFGFASYLNYKNLDFSFNMRASVGNRIYNAVNAGRAQYDLLNQQSSALGNIPTSVYDTGFNTSADVILSDIYIENASFLRLDNVTIGYTFPKWLEGKASLRFFTGVQNAFVITKYSGLDPEITNNGIDNTIYPRQRSFLFGANIKF